MTDNFYIKKDDNYPYYRIIVRSAEGAIDLIGSTITFTMRNLDTSINKIESVATLVPTIIGCVEYRWLVGDLDTVGEYGIEFEITLADNSVFTVPKGYTAKVIVEDTYDV